jgi:hypothetical protein
MFSIVYISLADAVDSTNFPTSYDNAVAHTSSLLVSHAAISNAPPLTVKAKSLSISAAAGDILPTKKQASNPSLSSSNYDYAVLNNGISICVTAVPSNPLVKHVAISSGSTSTDHQEMLTLMVQRLQKNHQEENIILVLEICLL